MAMSLMCLKNGVSLTKLYPWYVSQDYRDPWKASFAWIEVTRLVSSSTESMARNQSRSSIKSSLLRAKKIFSCNSMTILIKMSNLVNNESPISTIRNWRTLQMSGSVREDKCIYITLSKRSYLNLTAMFPNANTKDVDYRYYQDCVLHTQTMTNCLMMIWHYITKGQGHFLFGWYIYIYIYLNVIDLF